MSVDDRIVDERIRTLRRRIRIVQRILARKNPERAGFARSKIRYWAEELAELEGGTV